MTHTQEFQIRHKNRFMLTFSVVLYRDHLLQRHWKKDYCVQSTYEEVM